MLPPGGEGLYFRPVTTIQPDKVERPPQVRDPPAKERLMPRVARPLSASRRARWRTLLVLVALLGLLGPLPMNTAPRALADTTAPTTERVCSDPAPGEYGCYAVRQIRGGGAGASAATPSGYGPTDLRSAYNLTAASLTNGIGQTIAIIDAYDNPNAEANLAVYRAQFGLPPCTTANGCFSKINQMGGTNYPSFNAGWAGEIALDLDMASAICPNCKLLLVEAESSFFSDLNLAFTQAVAQGATVISNSYGSSESSTNEGIYSTASASGIAITVSSGDDGYGVSYPASSQYVTAVGGTSLAYNGSTYSETAWSYNATKQWGAGSGCSRSIAKPSWQTDTGCARRTVADVSAVADPYTGVATYDTNDPDTTKRGWAIYGGTSAAAPIIAGVYALAGATGTTPRNRLPYDNPTQLFDVTSGSTGSCGGSYLCTARSGYDGPTGLGSPNGLGAFGGPNVGTKPRPAPPVTPVPTTPTPTKTATTVTPTPTPITPTPTPPVTYAVSATASGSGTVSPAGATSYNAGTVASYSATPAADQVFLGWALDGVYVGYANPLTITVNGAHTLVARFAARPAFTDVPSGDPDYQAITMLAALGIINPTGVNGSGQFQPARGVARAEVAAFVARVFGWQNEGHTNRFPDQCDPAGQNCLDAELWNTVAALQDYGVVGGYTDGATCAASGTTAPCYLPRDPVLKLQIVSIVARAFTKAPDVRATGFWDRLAAVAGQYTNVPDSGTQRSDLATYRANAGTIPGQVSDDQFPAPTEAATRRFVIETLWQAYNAVYGIDRVP
jgi:hypothetical protein